MAPLDVDRPYRLNSSVALRPESFGALAYSYDNRQLAFLKTPRLLEVLRALDGASSASAALSAAGVPAPDRSVYTAALQRLADTDVLEAVPGERWESGLTSMPASGGVSGAVARAGAGAAGDLGGGGDRDGNRSGRLTDRFKSGLAAPICLTWELTYACNLACIHCLSSSGRRDPDELTTAEAMSVVDAMAEMGIFYVNIGGGEPTVRPDFWSLLDHAVDRRVGVKFSTNGVRLDAAAARRLADTDYVDVQISLDGATAETNDAIRGTDAYAMARRAMDELAAADFGPFKISVVVTRHVVPELDALSELAAGYGARLRLTRLRPSGRGAQTWPQLRLDQDQQRQVYRWLMAHPDVLTGDSFFHLSALGEPLPGLNLCGAGRVVCLIDPVGDVYACPFVLHERFRAGSVRDPGGFPSLWRGAPLFRELRAPGSAGACTSCGLYDACQGGCMAAKFFTGIALDGPDPECVLGHGEAALTAVAAAAIPSPGPGHSRRPVPVSIGRRP
jgi:mycofactocin biosynthetic radical S-adenosylmethionine protein MftC